MKQVSYLKVGENRGKKRIWLQGLRLGASGFDRGARYQVIYKHDTGEIELRISDIGDRVVSGRRQGQTVAPVIDLCNADLIRVTSGAERVRVVFKSNVIIITVHHQTLKQQAREAQIKKHLSEGQITEGSLCTGGGVATLAIKQGLKSVGVETTLEWIVDRERRYLDVAQTNNKAISEQTTLFESSLEELQPSLLTPVDLLQVSLPCTGHSIAGKSANKLKLAESHTTDATALFGFMKVVEAVNPSIIISENVCAARDSASYQLIKGYLAVLGYQINEIDLDQRQAGSVEKRKRYWFVALSKGLPAIGLSEIVSYPRQYQTVSELLQPVAESDPMWSENQYLKTKAIRDKLAGKGFARQLVDPSDEAIGCIGRGYAKRRGTEPMLTRADGKERLLTVTEHARAKGVPEALIANIGQTLGHEILGQSILFNHAVGIASAVFAQLTKGLKRSVSPMVEKNQTLDLFAR